MTRTDMQVRIREIKKELETRHKYGTVKMASPDGTPISIDVLQKELFSLIYKASKAND